MPKSLCNCELSVVCDRRCQRCHHCMWTVLATGLIIEISHFAHNAPSISNEIFSEYDLKFLNGSWFCFSFSYPLPLWLIIEPTYVRQKCIYTRAKHTKRTKSLTFVFWFMDIFHFCHYDFLIPTCLSYIWTWVFALRFMLHLPNMVSQRLFICQNAKWAQVHEDMCQIYMPIFYNMTGVLITITLLNC